MSASTNILYEHLKDYPTSTEGYYEIGNRAVAAAPIEAVVGHAAVGEQPQAGQPQPKRHFLCESQQLAPQPSALQLGQYAYGIDEHMVWIG
jgi:hypothetical protein